jgi:hypothetical protein
MNRWLLLRIVLLSAAMVWAIYSIGESPSVDLLAEVPVQLSPPAVRAVVAMGNMEQLTTVLERQAAAAAACGRRGTLQLTFGKGGLEAASWLGDDLGDARACVELALWAGTWPGLENPLQLDWPLQ